jgi:hypothetical protein
VKGRYALKAGVDIRTLEVCSRAITMCTATLATSIPRFRFRVKRTSNPVSAYNQPLNARPFPNLGIENVECVRSPSQSSIIVHTAQAFKDYQSALQPLFSPGIRGIAK